MTSLGVAKLNKGKPPLSFSPAGSSLSEFELAGLPPEMQLAAVQNALGQRAQQQKEVAQARQFESQDILDLLNTARIIEALTPGQAKLPNLALVDLPLNREGQETAPDELHEWFVDPTTGRPVAYVRKLLPEDPKSGTKVSQATISNLQQLLLTQGFVEELRSGMAERFGRETVEAGEVLDVLSGGLTGFDFDKAMTFLAANPDAISEFNNLLAEGSQRLAAGEDVGTVVRDLIKQRSEQPFGRGKIKPPPPPGLTPGSGQ